jgi:hypothetical protein
MCLGQFQIALPITSGLKVDKVLIERNGLPLQSSWSIGSDGDLRLTIRSEDCPIDLSSYKEQTIAVYVSLATGARLVLQHSVRPVTLTLEQLIPLLHYDVHQRQGDTPSAEELETSWQEFKTDLTSSPRH